jgi:ERCC4-type nuclease
MKIYVDTREPPKYIAWLMKTFPDMVFELATLREGDFATDRVIVERKKVEDLYGSIMGPNMRLKDQVDRMSCHQEQVQILLITGSVSEYLKNMKEIGVPVNPEIMFSMLAKICCSYSMPPWWFENEWHGLITMVKFMKKVDAGEYMVPLKRDPDILAAKLLGISTHQLGLLLDNHHSLVGIANATDSQLMAIRGIGPAKAGEIKRMLNS